MKPCYDYIWDAQTGNFLCNLPHASFIPIYIYLALFLVLIVCLLLIALANLHVAKATLVIIRQSQPVTGFGIKQLQGDNVMSILGVPLGGSGNFSQTPLPAGASLPTGITPVWSSSDSNVTLTPSADGSSCGVAVAASDTNTSFPLTVTASAALPNGSTPSSTVQVPILAPSVTGFDIEQTS